MNLKQFREIAEKQVVIRGMIQDSGVNPEARKGAGTQVLVQAYIISCRPDLGELAGVVSYLSDFEQQDPLAHDILHEVPVFNSSFANRIGTPWLNYWDMYRGPWCKPMQCVVAHEGPAQKFGEYQSVPLCVLLNLARVLEFLRGRIIGRAQNVTRSEFVLMQDLYVRITGFLSERQKKISNAVSELSGLLA